MRRTVADCNISGFGVKSKLYWRNKISEETKKSGTCERAAQGSGTRSVNAIKGDTDVQTDDLLGSFISGHQRSSLPPLTALLAPQVLLQFPLEGELLFFFLEGEVRTPLAVLPPSPNLFGSPSSTPMGQVTALHCEGPREP